MPKLTVDDLKQLREKAKDRLTLRTGEAKAKVIVHMSTCGIAAGARDVLDAFLKEIDKRETTDIIVTTSSCAGLCSREPMATVEVQHQPPVKYVDLTADKARTIFEEHLINGKVVTQFALGAGSETTA
jgi:NADP-reducing hydrogenase subunit HndB